MRLSRATAASLAEREQRQWLMLTAQLFGTGRQWRHLDQALDVLWQAGAWREELIQLLELMAERADRRLHPLPWALPVPFCVHGHYTRAEIEAAFGVLTTDTPGSTAKACSGTNPAIPACCSWLSTRVKPSSPPPPAPANWPSA
jgi:hypothetical protein